MKKTIITFTLLAVIALSVFAQQYDPESDFKVEKSKDGKSVTITKYVGSKKTVNIPPRIQGLPVTVIGDNAFENIWVDSLVLPEGIEKIGDLPKSLKMLYIPASVTKINEDYFAKYMFDLINIEVAKDNKYYSVIDGVLFNKSQTVLIRYPPNKDNKSYRIPNTVTHIGNYAFSAFHWSGAETSHPLQEVKNIYLPKGLIHIGERAFYGMMGLKEIELPESLVSIGSFAFANCYSLSYIFIPLNVNQIGFAPFDTCTSLVMIYVDENNNYFKSVDGVLFNKQINVLLQYPIGRKLPESYTVPSTVSEIKDFAFSGGVHLETLILSPRIRIIGINTLEGFDQFLFYSRKTDGGEYVPGYTKNLYISRNTTISDNVNTKGIKIHYLEDKE